MQAIESAVGVGVAAGGEEWEEADRQLRRLARARAKIDAEEARWLRVAARTGVHVRYGFATMLEYMERVLGHSPGVAMERLRVADALELLPEIDEALANGRICYSAVREVTRVAKPHTEKAWLAVAARPLREVEAAVSGRMPGDLPGDRCDPERVRQKLRFEVPAAVFALYRDARQRLELDAGHSLDEDEVLEAMCRAVLGGPDEVGRANYQIALTVCEECGRTWQDGAGRPIEVPETVRERAECDAQMLGRVDADRPERARQDVAPAVRRLVHRRDHGRCVVPGCRSARYLDTHHIVFRSEGGSDEPDNLVIACDSHHRALHEGRLSMQGTASELHVLRADGQPYRSTEPLAGPDVQADAGMLSLVIDALRKMGFSAAEAKERVGRARPHVGAAASLDLLLRAALAMQ